MVQAASIVRRRFRAGGCIARCFQHDEGRLFNSGSFDRVFAIAGRVASASAAHLLPDGLGDVVASDRDDGQGDDVLETHGMILREANRNLIRGEGGDIRKPRHISERKHGPLPRLRLALNHRERRGALTA